jgi:hypothetical protein
MDRVPAEIFSAELFADDAIEWSGRPNTSVVFHPEDWFAVPFSLLWGGLSIFWTVETASHAQDQDWLAMVVGATFVTVGQYAIWGRFLYSHWLKKHTHYALTKRRALIVRKGWAARSSSSTYFDDLAIDKRVRADQIGSISFGGPVRGDWQRGKNSSPKPPTFEDIDDADAVFELILRLQKEERTNATA